MQFRMLSIALSLVFSMFSSIAFSVENKFLPSCIADGREIPVNNEDVLNWKESTKNQFKSRAHIKGVLVKELPDYTGHDHWIVQIGETENDIIEVIYNQEFGETPAAQIGDEFEACGDYITSKARTGKLAPSMAGAIIHWIHMSPDTKRHESGFLIVKGIVCGMNDPQNSRP